MATNQESGGKEQGKQERGFAAMDEEKQRAIASKGGQAAHEKGTAHEFDSEEARKAGQKGGEEVSSDREHMAEIGRKGAESRAARMQEERSQSSQSASEKEGEEESGEDGDESSGSHPATRGGSSEQHAKAGSQSHKNQ